MYAKKDEVVSRRWRILSRSLGVGDDSQVRCLKSHQDPESGIRISGTSTELTLDEVQDLTVLLEYSREIPMQPDRYVLQTLYGAPKSP